MIFIIFIIILLNTSFGYSSTDSLDTTELNKKLKIVESFGKKLYDYDVACWIATDTLFSINPDKSQIGYFFAFENNGIWQVGFGRPNSNNTKFLVSYEAFYNPSTNLCKIQVYKIPKEDKGFYYYSNKALSKAFELFNPEYSPYNYAILPINEKQFYVYIYPSQQSYNIYRFGGDIRYTYSIDEEQITDSLRLHRKVLEMPYVSNGNDSIQVTYHNAVATKIPVETDILYVLSRKISAQHYVITKEWVFIITEKGTIVRMPSDVFFKKSTGS